LLSAPQTALPGGLPAALAHCSRALPGLEFRLSTLKPIEIERLILTGELDAGIVAAHAPAAGLVQHRLYAETSHLWVGPGHPWYGRPGRALTVADLAQARFVADPFWRDLPHPELAGHHASATQADSLEGAALLVASGQFAGFLPDHLVDALPALSRLRRVQAQRFGYSQDIVLTCRAGKLAGPLRLWVERLLDSAEAAGQRSP
jgi:LysR family transcriptional regulator, transcriptional activator for bauABCD operon